MKLRHVVTALAVCVPLLAQNPAPPAPKAGSGQAPKGDAARVEERAQNMRDTIDSGRPLQSHVRVAVRLKNGNKLTGVVKDGRLVERVDGLRFVEAQAKDRGAGIRLWYSSGARNYVFVPFADFAEYEVLQRLSQKQIEELEHEMQMNERRAGERVGDAQRKAAGGATAAPADAAPADGAPAGEAPPAPAQETAPVAAADAQQPAAGTAGAPAASKGASTKESTSKDQEQQRQWFALLQSYPPAAGWGKAKRDEIARRFVVVGSKPSESELKFVDQFAEWEKACAHFGIEAKAEAEGGKAGKAGKTTRKASDAEPNEAPDGAGKPAAGEGDAAAATEGESAGKKRKKK